MDPGIRTVGVVGAGTMGAGIGQLALEAGHDVILQDVAAEALAGGITRIRTGLARRAARLGLDPDAIDDWVDGRAERLRTSLTLAPLAASDLIIEAVVEDLEVKRHLFGRLERTARPDTILATNTSALSVAAIAAATRSPGRVAGLHFFNPAPVMRLVEVVVTDATAPRIGERLSALMERWDRVPVRSADRPGFIVNRVNRPFTLEALAALEAGTAEVDAIDRAAREAGYPMGPFELMDLVGLDVNLAVATALHAAAVAAGDPLADRFRPSPIQERMVAEGRLGRKRGAGFHRYDEVGDPVAPGPPPSAAAPADLAAADVVRRTDLAVVNEAYRALGDGVATASDIDLALRLGAGHPLGPFERVEQMDGPAAVLEQLRAVVDGGPRFVPAPALETAVSA